SSYSLPFMMIGVLRVPSSGFFQSRFSPSGDQLLTSPFSREMPFISGPRQWGQSSGSTAPGSSASAGREKSLSTAKHSTPKQTLRNRLPIILVLSLGRLGIRQAVCRSQHQRTQTGHRGAPCNSYVLKIHRAGETDKYVGSAPRVRLV